MFEINPPWLDKALENLESARSELINRRYNSCANRSYYACFHAAIYALIREGTQVRRDQGRWGHDFVQAEFARQLIDRRKLYAAVLRSTLSENFALRRIADYRTELVSANGAVRSVARTEQFIAAIRAREH